MTLAKQDIHHPPPPNPGASSLIWLLSAPRHFAIKEGSTPNPPSTRIVQGSRRAAAAQPSRLVSACQLVPTDHYYTKYCNNDGGEELCLPAGMPASKSPVPQNSVAGDVFLGWNMQQKAGLLWHW